MSQLVIFSIRIVFKTCTGVFNVSKDHELRCLANGLKNMALILIAEFQIILETRSLFCGLKLVGLIKSFQYA